MALNEADRLAVLPNIMPRVCGMVAHYATYLLGIQATQEQRHWARAALANVGSMATRVSLYLTNVPEFIDHGSSIADAPLKAAVETAINSHFIADAEELAQ